MKPVVETFSFRSWIRGVWWDELHYADGSKEITEKKENKIVLDARLLVAALLRNDSNWPNGILQHALGEGLVAWDTVLPDPDDDQHALVTEIYRKAPDYIDFVDESDVVVTPTPSNRIRVQTLYDITVLPGGASVREQGLFCGNATGIADSGVLFSVINHPGRWKDNTIEMIRYWTLIF